MSGLAGFSLRQLLDFKGYGPGAKYAINVGKVLPATATGNLFQVTGAIDVLSLVGVVSTALAITAVKPSLGITGNNTALAAQPAAAYVSTAVGAVVALPSSLGAALPAAVVATGTPASAGEFSVSNTNITITTDATNTGAITWLLLWAPLNRKTPAAVANL